LRPIPVERGGGLLALTAKQGIDGNAKRFCERHQRSDGWVVLALFDSFDGLAAHATQICHFLERPTQSLSVTLNALTQPINGRQASPHFDKMAQGGAASKQWGWAARAEVQAPAQIAVQLGGAIQGYNPHLQAPTTTRIESLICNLHMQVLLARVLAMIQAHQSTSLTAWGFARVTAAQSSVASKLRFPDMRLPQAFQGLVWSALVGVVAFGGEARGADLETQINVRETTALASGYAPGAAQFADSAAATRLQLGNFSAQIGSRGGELAVYGELAGAWSSPDVERSLVQSVPSLNVRYWPLESLSISGGVGYSLLLGSCDQSLMTLGQGPELKLGANYLVQAAPALALDLALQSRVSDSNLLPLNFAYTGARAVSTTFALGVSWR
jgi:hypothetical protein